MTSAVVTASGSEQKNAALPALTGARFFAAFAIVIWHYGQDPLRAVAPMSARLAVAGPTGVSFFYVLSGAVLTWSASSRARPARAFWTIRAARILPAYLLALVVSLLPFASHVLTLHHGLPGLARIALGTLAASLLVQAFFPPLGSGLNTPGWSVSCEAFFYLLCPSLSARIRSARPGFPWRSGLLWCGLAVCVPLLAMGALRAGLVPDGPFPSLFEDVSGSELVARWVSYFPPFRVPEFALGIVLGRALRCTPAKERSSVVDTARELLLVGMLLLCAWALGSGLPTRLTGVSVADRLAIESGVLAPLFALLLWQLARGNGWLQRLLAVPALVALGEASYALYILQEPVVVWLSALLKRVAPALASHWNVVFWAYAAFLTLLSLLVHRFVEQPVRARFLRRFMPGRTIA